MKKALFWLFLIAWLPATGWATEAYEYASTAIDAFSVVKEATSAPVADHSAADTPTDEFVATAIASMKSAMTQARAFSVAREKLDSFSKSDDNEIRQTAALFTAALYLLQVNSEQRVTAYEAFLNNPQDSLDAAGTVMRRLFELEEDLKTAWDAFARTGIAITYSLSDSTRSSNGALHHLKITQTEREQLKTQLVQAFGPSIKSGIDSRTYINRIPAAALWQFLNDRWESADGKQ